MKKIMIIDGGPRKTMNTAKMVEEFAKGAKSMGKDIEVKHVRLYDIDYKGCYACMACKVKGKRIDSCSMKDGMTEILREASFADGLCFASPIYYGTVTAQTQAFIERLTYPWLSYEDMTKKAAPKRMPTAFIYTMNAGAEQMNYAEPGMDRTDNLLAMFLPKPERIMALSTKQVKNYDRYAFHPEVAKAHDEWHATHFDEELQHAFDAGKRMVEKIIANQ
ncbi:MAG: flavodoxin family protein [Bacteroidales bacterium]|nr:flavodoxin family protein [Bacteroidaceae bacterium]MDY5968469.1 flavodoxin family protein [Bacteroidales bacterium]